MGTKQLNRRDFLRLSTMVAAGSALVACAPVAPAPAAEQAEAPAEGAPAPAAATVRLSMISPALGGGWLEKLEDELVPQFMDANAQIAEVEFIATDWGKINEQLLAAFASGDPPDLFEHGSSASGASWAASGQVMALDDYFGNWDRKDDYFENTLETAYFQGELFSIPRRMAPTANAYRKDFFEEAGLDPEQTPETWEELREMALALTQREDDKLTRAGYLCPTQSWGGIQQGWFPFLHQNGSSILNEEMTAVAFDSPEGLEAMNWYHDLIWQDQVDVLGGIPSALDAAAVNIGTAAIQNGGVEIVNQAKSNFPDVYPVLGFFMPTTRARPASILAVDRIFIAKATRALDEAWAFLTFLHQPENLNTRYLLMGDMPPTRSFVESPEIQEEPLLQTLLAASDYGYQWPATPQWNDIRNQLPAMSDAFLAQEGPVDPFVLDAAREINAVLQS